MQSFGAMLLNREEVDKLRAVCLPEGIANKKLVGKSPATLLEAAEYRFRQKHLDY
jgi:propionaldehyde dehydrogenase